MIRLARLTSIAAAMALGLGAATAAHAAVHAAPAQATVLVVPHPGEAPGARDAGPAGAVLVRTLAQAQAAVRGLAGRADVTVELTPGTYRLTAPMRFTAADSGRDGHTVTWTSAPGGTAVISGASRVTGWRTYDAARNIWAARVRPGSSARQLFIDGVPAPVAAIPLPRSDVTFTGQGLSLRSPALDYLSSLPDQSAIELESLGSFTDRYSPVRRITGSTIVMQQPAWENNVWGYDTLPSPYNGGTMYLENSYAFLQPGQWYLNSARGALYYRAPAGQDPARLDVELPHLQSLVQIGGRYADPVRGLSFRGIEFTGTTWLQPSSGQGYADQQSGAHIVGSYPQPPDALTSCQNGCPLFEATRNQWWQIPAAVQVSAARDISFRGDTFTDLGQVGLGIGNDADANAAGIGLGVSDVSVSGSRFTQDAASAIAVGGIQPDAHHPSNPAMIVKDISLTGNTITSVARDYKDSPGILSTYVDHAVISHNTLSDLPYDGIDLGWGWGTNDPGGNTYYRQAGLYSYQPVYQTPTTLRDNVVSGNLIYDTKNSFYDGGSIYNLSASPGTVITRNYVYDNHDTFGVLLDQGSRYITMSGNVLAGCSNWVYVNADTKSVDTYQTMDNLMTGNWYNSGSAHAPDGPGYDNVVTGNTQVSGDSWPSGAQAVIAVAGAGGASG